MKFLIILIVLQTWILSFSSELLEFHSFEPPYAEVDTITGQRIIPNWRTAGTTVVNNNFIRITPDRQSKKGALWSRKAIDSASMSSVLKFRISGQGKNFYGDGLAMWIVQSSYYTEGDLHGFQEKFKGIGIIFDTFKNIETVNVHRDVTVLVNDGEKTWAMMTEDVQGCNINVRYHAERADFSVEDASKAKVIINGNNLQLMVDARDTGDWIECVNLKNLPLSSDWLKDAHIGLTATTGQLADNHDVLSLVTYDDAEVLEVKEAEKAKKRYYEALPESPIPDRVLK
jgi:lectin, mannose-binding 2